MGRPILPRPITPTRTIAASSRGTGAAVAKLYAVWWRRSRPSGEKLHALYDAITMRVMGCDGLPGAARMGKSGRLGVGGEVRVARHRRITAAVTGGGVVGAAGGV